MINDRKPMKIDQEVHRLTKLFCARHGMVMQRYIEAAIIRSLAEDFSVDAVLAECRKEQLPDQATELLQNLYSLDSDQLGLTLHVKR